MLSLGVLDQSPVAAGSSPADALHETLALARLTDELGFGRYWVAEHHGGGMLAGPAPEVLIGPIAAATQRIRVGSGGVMLPHYSPLKVAEAFSLLAGLHPDRIDLGVGRAAGTDQRTTLALQRDRSRLLGDDFPEQLAELLALLEDRMPADHPFAPLARALPGLPHAPEPWLLGSSPQSGLWAAELGLPYAFADFINPKGAPIARRYAEDFRPQGRAHEAPRVAVATWALAADTEAEAERLASSSRMAMALLREGRPGPIPSPETAERFLAATGARRPGGSSSGRRMTLGTGEQVRAGLEAIAAEYGAQELFVVTITHDPEARRRSYELIAEAFGLSRVEAVATAAA